MRLNDNIIDTPYDDPVQYNPAWRSMIAKEIVDTPRPKFTRIYRPIAEDKWIRQQIQYLRLARRRDDLRPNMVPLHYANGWFQGTSPASTKFRLEALLLTAASLDTIAADIGGASMPVEPFKLYERLFFNIRNDDGTIHDSFHLRTYFALPDGKIHKGMADEVAWKVIAANMGYDVLTTVWHWNFAKGKGAYNQEYIMQALWSLAQSRLFLDIVSRKVDHYNISNIMRAITENTRMQRETDAELQQADDASTALLSLLALTAPQLRSAAKDVDANNELTANIRARLLSQNRDTIQEVLDRGEAAGAKGVDDLINKHFKQRRN